MWTLRRLFPRLAALALLASSAAPFHSGIGPAIAQAPPPVPALPDAERRTSLVIASSTCVCAVGFAIYGDGTDVDQWVQVYIGTTRYLSTDVTFGWSLSSATGPFATIPRPITNAVLTFNSAQSGTVQIVGARRPRRTAQFSENRGVAARDVNQVFTDETAMLREAWDKLQGALVGQPGESILRLPPAATRANQVLAFNAQGDPTVVSVPATIPSGQVTGPGSSTVGHPATWNNTLGTALVDTPVLGVAVGGTGQSTLTLGGVLLGNGTSGVNVATIGTAGNVLIDQGAGVPPVFKPLSGGATVSASGVVTLALAPTLTGTLTLSGNPLLNLVGTGNVNVSNLAQNTIQFQGAGNSLTTSIHLNPGSGTLPTGTITEFVSERTNLQAFGGNYGRWSYSNLGSGQANISGIIGEFGGTTATGALGPYLLQIGIENPPATFTVFEGWRFYTAPGISEDDNQGSLGFGNGATVPRNQITLTMTNIGAPGTRDSHALLWEGKANNGTERAVWWRQKVNVTSNAGASSYLWQQSLNTVGVFNTRMSLSDVGDLSVTGMVRSTAGAPTITGGACGAGANGTVAGTNQSGIVTIGAAATTTCTINFSATLANAPGACVIFPGNATAAAQGTTVARVGTPSTTTWVITGSVLASAVYSYICL